MPRHQPPARHRGDPGKPRHRQEGLPQHPRGEDQGLEEALGHRPPSLRVRILGREGPVREGAGEPGHGQDGVQLRHSAGGRGQGPQLIQHRDKSSGVSHSGMSTCQCTVGT